MTEEKEWLIVTDERYKHEGKEFDPSRRLQGLLEDGRAKKHQQDDGSYILSYIDDDLYKEIREEMQHCKYDPTHPSENKEER